VDVSLADAGTPVGSYSIVTNFPKRTLDNNEATLRELAQVGWGVCSQRAGGEGMTARGCRFGLKQPLRLSRLDRSHVTRVSDPLVVCVRVRGAGAW
jgi:hypothetical protein